MRRWVVFIFRFHCVTIREVIQSTAKFVIISRDCYYQLPEFQDQSSVMSNQQVGAVALVALASWALAKLGYSLVTAPKQSNLTLYIHELRAPPDSTVLAAAGTGQNDFTQIGFGSFLVFDNEVRDSPDRNNSVLLGRERGYGPISDLQGKQGIQLMSTLVFGRGSSYHGTLTLQGNVGGASPTTELAVLSGTEDFRGARGHAVVETVKSGPLAVVFRWNIYLSY